MPKATLSRLELSDFTVFESLELLLTPGLNVFIGGNGTGKTHILKLLYAAVSASTNPGDRLQERVAKIFSPKDQSIGRLVRNESISGACKAVIGTSDEVLTLGFSSDGNVPKGRAPQCLRKPIPATFIPAKEMLANAPGFRSLFAKREIAFDVTYLDILDAAFLPRSKDVSMKQPNDGLCAQIQDVIGGRIETKGEEFLLHSKGGLIEFSLVAEGWRKLGLLWLLLRNGSIGPDSILLWDEPETNLNPELHMKVAEILMALQRSGAQVLVATHSYSFLKQVELNRQEGDRVRFHSFALDPQSRRVKYNSTDDYSMIDPNPILEAYTRLYDADVDRSLQRMGMTK